MPKRILTEEVAGEILTLALDDRLSKLKIRTYKSGKNKGRNYATYEEGDFPTPDLSKHYLRSILENVNRKIDTDLTEDGNVLFHIEETFKKE